MPVNLDKAEKYYKKGTKPIDRTITEQLKVDPDLILHGNKAINMQLPNYLQIYTEDYDLKSKNPEKDAKRIEGILDEQFGGDFFKVVPSSRYEGVWKIISRVTGRGVVDLSYYEIDIPHKIMDGIKVATLQHHLDRIRVTLADPAKKFRWTKEKETRQRIKIAKRRKRK